MLQGKLARHVMFGVLAAAALAASARPARADDVRILKYNGGPVLTSFKIHPLYYGKGWTTAMVDAQQSYLTGLAKYISGGFNPANQLPTTKQYGVHSATVAGRQFAGSTVAPKNLTGADIKNIIHAAQNAGTLPAYSSSRLLMVFTATGFRQAPGVCDMSGNPGFCGYHASESTSSFFATVPFDSGPSLAAVSAHEVFEAAMDPAINHKGGWDESVDGCSTGFNVGFGSVPGIHDNMLSGACSATGFIADQPGPTNCGLLFGSQWLIAGTSHSSAKSCDGRFTLSLATDGALTQTKSGTGTIWSANTKGSFAVAARMQSDGNFVLYRGFVGAPENVVWATTTWGQSGALLKIQDDSNLVIYNGSRPIWASQQPAPPTACGVLTTGQGLSQGTSMNSCDGRFTLKMQDDGNLVLYQGATPLWGSGTFGFGNLVHAVMQSDGNFVLNNRATNPATPIWGSGTFSFPGARLLVQNDGNVVVYDTAGVPRWSTNTCCR